MIELLPHNSIAAGKAIGMLQDRGKAAVVHATGTGKSYVAAAVCETYKKVLMISPSVHIIEQNMQVIGDNIEAMTYQKLILIKPEDMPTGYDLIYLDEFHHVGADVWGKSIDSLIKANAGAHLFGTSATAIRYRDNMKNMADELFDGNIASELSLAEAIEKGILPTPIYVRSLIDLEDTRKEALDKINRSNANGKESARKKMNNVANNWQKSHGVPAIFRKYMQEDVKRMIVFCQSIEIAGRCRALVSQWLNEAGYNEVRMYHIDSSSRDPQKEIRRFEKSKFEGLKVAVSVNMLNEGLHIDGVDCIVMLRQTMSRIVLEQQIGRCVKSGAKRSPLIFDLVNNMQNVDYGIKIECESSSTDKVLPESYSKREKNVLPFEVIDECEDIRDMLKEIDDKFGLKHHWKVEEAKEIIGRYECLNDFVKENKNLYVWLFKKGLFYELCSGLSRYRDMIKLTLTKEECAEVAKKYKTRSQFRVGDRKIYEHVLKNGWLDELLPAKYKPIDVDELLRIAWSCSSYEEFQEKHPMWWRRAKSIHVIRRIRQKFGKKYTALMTDKEIIDDVNRMKQSKIPYSESSVYKIGRRRGIIKPRSIKQYTDEELIAMTNDCNTISEFMRKHSTEYQMILRRGIKEEAFKHMYKKRPKIDTEEYKQRCLYIYDRLPEVFYKRDHVDKFDYFCNRLKYLVKHGYVVVLKNNSYKKVWKSH